MIYDKVISSTGSLPAVEDPETSTENSYVFANGTHFAKVEGPIGTSAELYYYHNDHLGSPMAITDSQGNLAWPQDYLPYGEALNESASQTKTRFTFTGKELDPATGLMYYNARWYDPDLGRFITEDMNAGDPNKPLTLNRFAYVTGNPLKYVDPSGHREIVGDDPRTETRAERKASLEREADKPRRERERREREIPERVDPTGSTEKIPKAIKMWPVRGDYKITSLFGPRKHPITGEAEKMHKGIDIAIPSGTEVVSIGSGEVIQVNDTNNVGFGKSVVIRDVYGETVTYGHLSDNSMASPGDKVKQGDLIGLSGSSGASTGPHLHLQIVVEGKAVDPLSYSWL